VLELNVGVDHLVVVEQLHGPDEVVDDRADRRHRNWRHPPKVLAAVQRRSVALEDETEVAASAERAKIAQEELPIRIDLVHHLKQPDLPFGLPLVRKPSRKSLDRNPLARLEVRAFLHAAVSRRHRIRYNPVAPIRTFHQLALQRGVARPQVQPVHRYVRTDRAE
jgi:hypothetical protein